MKKHLLIIVIFFSNSILANTCNVNTSRSKSPWHYTNPNTACGIEFSMPGLPDFSLDWELPDLNICNAVRDYADDLIGDEYDDLIDIPGNREGGGTPTPGGGSLPPGVELPPEVCEQMPKLCGEEDINPRLNLPPSKASQTTQHIKEESVFCHPNNPHDTRNHSSCRYRKISTESNEKTFSSKNSAADTTSNTSSKSSESYWSKRYNKKKDGNE